MQKSKIQSWCEHIIEAGWLAALIVAPLFFNVFSSRVFEPDKISLVRSISLVMLLAYLIRLADGGPFWLPAHSASTEETQPDVPDSGSSQSGFARFIRIPLLLPLILLITSYIISTALSVAPSVSWWGSYQRLQGTYSYFSYIIIAVLTAAHLRAPEQLRRLQHTIILTSLPIAIYGVIQHYAIDPLPWGGDVITRVSGNAGNPIFLAAHLIIAAFLTLERIFSSFAFLLRSDNKQDDDSPPVHDIPSALVGGSYLFVFIVQLLAIFWTQSRGPWLGLAAGLYIFVLLLITGLRPSRYRAWTAGWVGLGVAGAVFLILINTTSFLPGLANVPYVGRLTSLLNSEQGTGLVRVLIWEGVSQMVAPHEPITFPDGEPDSVNLIRPLIGYGPEAMWVAYNNFYPPALAQVEARNASPDRSHNETWDSLAITGAFGFLAYVLMFMMIFYWALRWLGLITSRRDLYLFLGTWLGGGTLVSAAFIISDGSWRFFGVALPTGFIVGLVLYVTLAVFLHPETKIETSDRRRQLLIVAILSAIVAHYVEIHFGIAIAATRTYFWVLSAVLLVLGMRWLTPETFAETAEQTPVERSGRSTRRQRPRNVSASRQEDSFLSALPSTVMPDMLVMLTLVYLYTTNFQGKTGAFEILTSSLTTRMSGGQSVSSPGILFLLLFTWLISTFIGLSVAALRSSEGRSPGWWLRGFLLYSGVLWGGWLIYGLVQAGRLVPGAAGNQLTEQLGHIAGHFSVYTWLVVFWMAVAGTVFAWSALSESRRRAASRALFSIVGGAVMTVITFLIVANVNIALVRADVFYKQGQQFDSTGDWVGSVELYRRSLAVRPSEDHYMLFLGRSLLEQAKRAPAESPLSMPDPMTVQMVLGLTAQEVSQMGQVDLLRAAETILLEAQRVNPLNTDHTANLARLYRSWADLESDPSRRETYLAKSLADYKTAVTLSPHAAHLWNEMGATLTLMGRNDEAEATYLHSLSLDDRFENTYLLLAEFYDRAGETDKLADLLKKGLEQIPGSSQLRSFLGVVLARTGDMEGALETNLGIVEQNPNDLNAVRNLAILYRDMDKPEDSILWAERAVEMAGSDPTIALPILRLLAELYNGQGDSAQVTIQYERMAALAPEDTSVLSTLASLYLQAQRIDDSIRVLQQLTTLDPTNYLYPLQMAQVYAQTGDLTTASTFAQSALELAPDAEKPGIEQFLATLGG
ncbi:MAG: tetratricopeptide repeat protein [Caldilineaceae bacterium]